MRVTSDSCSVVSPVAARDSVRSTCASLVKWSVTNARVSAETTGYIELMASVGECRQLAAAIAMNAMPAARRMTVLMNVLLGPQRFCRIDARCPTGRNPARRGRDDKEDNRRASKGQRIGRRHAEEQRAQVARDEREDHETERAAE